MSSGRARDGVIVRRLPGQSCEGLHLFYVSHEGAEVCYIDAAGPADAREQAQRRWAQIDAIRAERAARRERLHNAGVEEWAELAALFWEVLLHG